MRRIFTADTAAAAHVVAGMLDEEGIPAVVEGEMLTGARYLIGVDESTEASVSVRDEDVARANSVLADRALPETGEELAESRGLVWFKRGLQIWLAVTALTFAWMVVVAPGALAICAAFGIVAVLVAFPKRPRRMATRVP